MKKSTVNLIIGILAIVLIGGFIMSMSDDIADWLDIGDSNVGGGGNGNNVENDSGTEKESTVDQSNCTHAKTDVVVVPSTCGKEGTRTVICTDCGLVISETIVAKLTYHSYSSTYYEVNTRQHAHKCTVCGFEEKTDHILPTQGEVVEAATCTKVGMAKVSCSLCSYYETVSLPMVSHSKSECNYVNGNEHTSACTVCGKVFAEKHIKTSVVVDTPATCETSGQEHYTCSACNADITSVIPAIGHTPVSDSYEFLNSITHTYVCSVCSETVYDTHIFRTGTVEPTCTEQGYSYQLCTICNGMNKYDYTSALGHKIKTLNYTSPSGSIGYRDICLRNNCNYESIHGEIK